MTETVSIVLPCFNEAGNIAQTVGAVQAWMEERWMRGEIIVVNDGSTDGTGEILERMQKEQSSLPLGGRGRERGSEDIPLRVITHPMNLGYGAAVRSGCDAATSNLMGFMDSDGQFDPKDFDRLLAFCHPEVRAAASHEGRHTCTMVRGLALSLTPHHDKLRATKGDTSVCDDVVIGRRRKRADPFLRKLNAKLFGILSWAMLGIWVRDMNCAMKVFRRSVWQRARPTVTTGALFNAEFFYNLKRAGIRWHQVDVAHYPRRAGKQTGANPWVIGRMFRELWVLKRGY